MSTCHSKLWKLFDKNSQMYITKVERPQSISLLSFISKKAVHLRLKKTCYSAIDIIVDYPQLSHLVMDLLSYPTNPLFYDLTIKQ